MYLEIESSHSALTLLVFKVLWDSSKNTEMKKQTTRIIIQAIVLFICMLIGMALCGFLMSKCLHYGGWTLRRPITNIGFAVFLSISWAIIEIIKQRKNHHDKNTGEENQ